ncbi:amino acid permease [Wolbachia endosymbiont of Brugia malayi]|uniref:APC family permease n=1 Tax=unclassified Wolbachia TaxID=2640676 RepID=UPI00004C923D|nr:MULTISPECIES: amino acid permease [unclassified Wolbachia]AAW70636.1 Amino acid transporter [Wolbachia endosymbiont strain TRS of Brugia malayi]QCB61623.1 amino acid permease [Wolbachia endosymbiont of Brugia malayi]QIT36296.1 amino acid permease family protein [Wolbachia endosymbiont of Brugia pahangi]
MSNKIGFLAVFALVISSQIGSGIFMLPISLAPYSTYSLISWAISGFGAVSLALVFATLCAKFPETGGPHVYVKHAFGPTAAFFVGWTYWVISWVSTTALIVVGVGYLTPFLHEEIKNIHLFLELLLFTIITLINLRGVATAGRVEFLLTVIKIAVLLAIPVMALFFFNRNNFIISKEMSSLTISQILARSTLLTLWCFVGVELATAPAGSVNNPAKTIPRAVVLGTICVAIIYFINNFAIMGLINGNDLANSRAPYVDAIKIMFSGNWHLIISIVAFVFCVGSLNAWVLSSGQVAFGLAKDRLMPQLFAKRNEHGSPFWGITTSSSGTAILLILTSNNNFAQQITSIIDFSVVSFLFVYLACSLAFLKVVIKERNYHKLLTGSIATTFCCWVILETSINTLLIASLFTTSGIPLYLFWYRRASAQ